MKPILIVIIIALLPACWKSEQERLPFTDDVIIRDRTDPHQLAPDAKAHVGALDLAVNKQGEVWLRYTEIGDQRTVSVTVLHLPCAEETEAKNVNETPLYRERTVVHFIDTVQKTLSQAATGADSSRLGHSEIFSMLAGQLSALAKRKAQRKRLFAYSDLQERSAFFDSYSAKSQTLLARHPDSVVKRFESYKLLPERLDGITVYFIYDPVTREEDQRFIRMLNLYRRLLEPRGAAVISQAQNKSFEGID